MIQQTEVPKSIEVDQSQAVYFVDIAPRRPSTFDRIATFGPIKIDFDQPSLRIGEVLNNFGDPCSVTPVQDMANELAIHYSNAIFIVRSDGYSVAPAAYVERIIIEPPDETLCTNPVQYNTDTPWRGFRFYVEAE